MENPEKRKIFRQGDKFLLEVKKEKIDSDDIESLEKAKKVSSFVVAHGENGHSHILKGHIKNHQNYVQVLEQSELVHEDNQGNQGDHLPYTIPIGLYEILTEKSYNVFKNEIRYARD